MSGKSDKGENSEAVSIEIAKDNAYKPPQGVTNIDYNDPEIAALKPGVATGKYEVLVKEKKGFFGSAIPAKLPCCIAVLLCFFNCVVPGLGTFISAPFSLCEKEKVQKKRIRNCFINILAGFLQLATTPLLLIGWLWSIMWALEFLKPLKGEGYEDS